MTTRFGFYWGARPNSLVIGKDYSPKLLCRYLPKCDRKAVPGAEQSREYEDYRVATSIVSQPAAALDYGHAGQMTLSEVTGARYQGRKVAETAGKLFG